VEFGQSSLAQKPNGSGVQLINSSFSKGDMATWQIKRQSGEHLVINLLRDQIIHIRQPSKSIEQF